mgnify:CR=1 FL=1
MLLFFLNIFFIVSFFFLFSRFNFLSLIKEYLINIRSFSKLIIQDLEINQKQKKIYFEIKNIFLILLKILTFFLIIFIIIISLNFIHGDFIKNLINLNFLILSVIIYILFIFFRKFNDKI